jgi:hypothetical protein
MTGHDPVIELKAPVSFPSDRWGSAERSEGAGPAKPGAPDIDCPSRRRWVRM